MAISQFRNIAINVLGDGTSTIFSIDLSSAPVSIAQEAVGLITQPGFDFRVSPPSAILSIGISGMTHGVGISATLMRSILTITFATAPDSVNPTQIGVTLAF